jgi:SanA protein
MLKRLSRRFWRLTRNLFWLALAALLLPRAYTSLTTAAQRHTLDDAPQGEVAIIFGAGLRRDGQPAAVLRDRLDTGIALYHNGLVKKLLMSGQIPEPAAMLAYAIEQGVPAADIWLDEDGLRTYDTCYQANNSFNLNEAILVTQAYHLPRAVYLCNALGVEAQGIIAYQSNYWRGATTVWQVRESLATLVALWEVHISPPPITVSTFTLPQERSW